MDNYQESVIPPPPPGFILSDRKPMPPEGFVLSENIPAPPSGFQMLTGKPMAGTGLERPVEPITQKLAPSYLLGQKIAPTGMRDLEEYPFTRGLGNLTAEERNQGYEDWWKKREAEERAFGKEQERIRTEEEPFVVEKPDEATLERMRMVEKGVPFMPPTLGTFAIKAGKQLVEEPLSIIKGGVEAAKAIVQRPKEIIPAMKEAYDYATSHEGQKEMLKAGHENLIGLITFLPKTLINFVKNPQKQVMEDPVGTIFLMSAVGGGAARLVRSKLKSKSVIRPEEMRAAVEEIAPDEVRLEENLNRLKDLSARRPEEIQTWAEAPRARVTQPEEMAVGEEIRVHRDLDTGELVIKMPKGRVVQAAEPTVRPPEMAPKVEVPGERIMRLRKTLEKEPPSALASYLEEKKAEGYSEKDLKRSEGVIRSKAEAAGMDPDRFVIERMTSIEEGTKPIPAPALMGEEPFVAVAKEITTLDNYLAGLRTAELSEKEIAAQGALIRSRARLANMKPDDYVAKYITGVGGEPPVLTPPQIYKPKAKWPPGPEKYRARDRAEMVGLEAWEYDEKMGLPHKEKIPPIAPKGLYKGIPVEDRVRYDAAKGVLDDIKTAEMEWGDLNETEKELVKEWFPDDVERLKRIESAGMLVEEPELPVVPKEKPGVELSKREVGLETTKLLKKLGVPRQKWGPIYQRVIDNYKPEEGALENYIRRTTSYLTAEGEPFPRAGEPKEVPIEKIPEPKAIEPTPDTAFERSEVKEIVSLSLDKLSDQEKKIAQGIMEGRSLREDAALLKVSHEAVREQRQKILSKLRQDESLRKLTSFDKTIEDIDAEKRKLPKEEPPIGLTVKQVPRTTKEIPKYEFADKEREIDWQTGRKQKEPMGQRFHDYLTHIKNIWTRTYENLPNKPQFEEAKFQLKRLEKQRPISFYKTALVLRDVVPKDANLYDRFSRKVILDDFAEEIKQGAQVLPFGFDAKNIESEFKRINAEVEKYPELKASIENRKRIWKSLRESYIEAQERIGNHVEDKLRREDYYRHQVLKYAEAKNRIKGTGERLRTPAGRGFLKRRGAGGEVSVEPINIDYLEAESEVMAQMIHDIEIAKTLDKIHKTYGIEEKIISEAKAKGKDREMALSEENIPKGYRVWQPREGNVFYVANTISERTAKNILEGGLEGIGIKKVKIGEALAVGRERQKWVIPEEIADTLDNFMARKENNVILNLDRKLILGWKKWILSGPTKILKYNIRNLTGDAEHGFVGNTSGFAKVPRAMKELYDVYIRKAPMTEDMKEWFDRGGMQTLLAEQEIKELDYFKPLYGRGGLRIESLPKEALKGYWKTAKMTANLRESILRYANYLDYIDQTKANPEGRPKNFGASKKESVMALEDTKDRAFKLSNDLIGAYDNVTAAGQSMREFAWPFWSWLEVNPKIYFGLLRNAIQDKNISSFAGRKIVGSLAKAPITALRLGRFAVKAGVVYALIQSANNLLHKDEEDMLPEDVKNIQHIVLGKDAQGKTQYFSRIGALGDLFEWVGGVDNIAEVLTGKENLASFLEKIGKSAVNQIVQGINPAVKFGAETFAKKTIFPDIFEPKPIRNLTLHFFRQLGLANEYLAVSDLPSRPYKEKLSEYAIYKSDPLEASYYDILDKKREWLKEKGKYAFSVEYTPKNNALYYMKLAHKYGDKESENKFLKEYVSYVLMESGGSLSTADLQKKIGTSIRRSFENMNPLFGIKKEYLPEFLKSLDDLGKHRLAKAFQFYAETLIGNQNYRPEEATLESEK